MIFETLYDSAKKGELLLVDGGMCRYHLRRDGQLTIYEIIVLPEKQQQGIGRGILKALESEGSTSIFAKCPIHLQSNGWYESMGFDLEQTETLTSGNQVNHWRKRLI